MSERYLMTHSLLAAWMWAISENPYEDATSERDPMAEFMAVLHREPTPATDAMMDGIRFDSTIVGSEELLRFCRGELAMAFCWNVSQEISQTIGNPDLDFDIFPMAFPTDSGEPQPSARPRSTASTC